MTFSEKVLALVSKIPRGSVMTYRELAVRAGRPRAYRVVGNILNRNTYPASGHPLPKGEGHPLEIPCHRVVKSSGEVGGYVGGTKRKIMLLQKEGIFVKEGKIQITKNKQITNTNIQTPNRL